MTKETQQSVARWARETFGPATIMRSATRANEEVAELLSALSCDNRTQAAEEVSDVVICLYRLCEGMGIDLAREVDRKMARNRERVWKNDGHGCGYTKKDNA